MKQLTAQQSVAPAPALVSRRRPLATGWAAVFAAVLGATASVAQAEKIADVVFVPGQTHIEFSGYLGPTGPMYDRANSGTPPTSVYGSTFYFNVLPFTLRNSAAVRLETTSANLLPTITTPTDTFLALYANGFVPSDALLNAIEADDDGAGNLFSLIRQNLVSGTPYFVVATSYSPNGVGPYTLRMTTPSQVDLNGTYRGNVTVFDGTFGGNGTIIGQMVNYGTVSPGNSPGEIRVDGSYTQASSGTLRIELAGRRNGEFDLLSVASNANLNGNLELVRLNNFKLRRGDKITFLTAGTRVQGEFTSVTNPFATDTILNPTLNYEKHSVSLEVPTFSEYAAWAGFTPNQRAVAAAVDSTNYDRRARSLTSTLDNTSLGNLPAAFDQIAPEELTSIFTISTSLAVVQNTNLQRRTDDIRHGASGFSASGLAMQGTGPGYSGNFAMAASARPELGRGAAGPTGKETKDVVAPALEEKKWGVFLTGVGEWVDVGGDGNARGYDISTGGFTLGLDYKVSPNFVVGIAAGYAGTSSDLNGGGDVSVNGGKLGVYATFFQNAVGAAGPTGKETKDVQMPVSLGGGFYADVAVTGGYNSYDTERSALQGTARGSTDGGELNVLVGAGYDWKIGALTIGPTATYQYSLVGINSFTETGSLAPLNISNRNAESIRTTLGFKASYDWKIGGVLVRPEIRAAWQHEYGDSSYGLDASFANGAGNSFLVNGPEIGRDSLLLGAGVAIQCSERFSTYLYYDGELARTNYDRHGVSGGVRMSF